MASDDVVDMIRDYDAFPIFNDGNFMMQNRILFLEFLNKINHERKNDDE